MTRTLAGDGERLFFSDGEILFIATLEQLQQNTLSGQLRLGLDFGAHRIRSLGSWVAVLGEKAVSLVDVIPTLADYLGRPELGRGGDGRSLMPLLRADGVGARNVGPWVPAMRVNEKNYTREFDRKRGNVNVVVREDAWKGIWNHERATLELYDLATDPLERADVQNDHPERSARMREFARTWLSYCNARGAGEQRHRSELDEADRENLRELGYVE